MQRMPTCPLIRPCRLHLDTLEKVCQQAYDVSRADAMLMAAPVFRPVQGLVT